MAYRIGVGGASYTFMRTLTRLLADLNSDDMARYLAAKDQLVKRGQMAISALINMMLTKTEREGWRAANVLAAMTDVNTTSAFVVALKSRNPLVRQTAAQVLGEQEDKAVVPNLLDCLNDDNYIVQMWAVESLGNLGDKRAVESLATLLMQTDSPLIQHTTIKALGRIGDTVVAPLLVQFFNSTDPYVPVSAHEVYLELTDAGEEAH